MRGWMLAGLGRRPGPMIGTLAAAATAATLAIAAFGVAGAHSPSPLGRLAGADVVVAADPQLRVTTGTAESQTTPLPVYRGVPAQLTNQLARVKGVAAATGETGVPRRHRKARDGGPDRGRGRSGRQYRHARPADKGQPA